MAKKWSRKELKILRQRYRQWSPRRLEAALPGRRWHPILAKAWKMGLKRPRKGVLTRQTLRIPKSNIVLAYAAGLIDGEGYMTRHMMNGGKYSGWKVGLANTHRGVIEWLIRQFGGSIHTYQPPLARRKLQYKWYCGGRLNCWAFLNAVRPYLIIKTVRADLFIRTLRPYVKALREGRFPSDREAPPFPPSRA